MNVFDENVVATQRELLRSWKIHKPDLCHLGYCLVFLDVAFDEAAAFIRRFLRHAAFRTQARRMGKVVRVYHHGVSYWEVNVKKAQVLGW